MRAAPGCRRQQLPLDPALPADRGPGLPHRRRRSPATGSVPRSRASAIRTARASPTSRSASRRPRRSALGRRRGRRGARPAQHHAPQPRQRASPAALLRSAGGRGSGRVAVGRGRPRRRRPHRHARRAPGESAFAGAAYLLRGASGATSDLANATSKIAPAGAGAQAGSGVESVGETMAIGRTFKESLQKALRGLEVNRFGLGCDRKDRWGTLTRQRARRSPTSSPARTRSGSGISVTPSSRG